ncbi:MAG: hypothetical protein AAGT88_07580 [Dethiobacter sp.]
MKQEALEITKVFDIDAKNLRQIGFLEDVVKEVDQINRKSMRSIPASVTGIGDRLLNLMRGASKDLFIFGRHFDNYIKYATYARYRSALALPYQVQLGFETGVQGAMLVGGKYLPGAETLLKMSNVLPDKAIFGIIGRMKNVLRRTVFIPDVKDVDLMQRYVISDVLKGLLDEVAGSVELSHIQQQLSKSRGVVNGNKLNKLYQKQIQMWAVDKVTRINMAFAEKFGMTLKQVFATTADGNFINPHLVRETKELTQQLLGYKPGFLTSPLAKTLNLVFFPFRFQAKTMSVTAQWLDNLSPATRLGVVESWIHFANWAGTEDGIEWRRTHRSLLYSFLAYATAYAQIGESINAVSRGQVFGGNAGLIGGIPFGWMVEFARELAVIPEDPESFDPKTGRPFEFRETPRDITSFATFVKFIEQYLFTVMPGMPLYTITGGIITQASWRHLLQNIIEGVYGGILLHETGFPKEAKDALIREQFMKVPIDETVPLFDR